MKNGQHGHSPARTHLDAGCPAARSVIDFGDSALNEAIATGIDQVEALLDKEIASGADFMADKVRHLKAAGGKRFRPMFALLASQYGPRPGCEDVIKAATVVEMTHLATLYHDDVMDEAPSRRGVDSANARWNNSVAILAGDYLLARASQLMAELGVGTVAHFAETFGDLVTGQMRETIGPGDSDVIDHYMAVIREKTGVLIASAGYLGALHSGATDDTIDALHKLGAAVGLAFQIVDDMIDIWSTNRQSGKTTGTDLKEGVYTLPVLYALKDPSEAGEKLRGILNGPLPEEQVQTVIDLIGQTNGREKTIEVIDRTLMEADAQLARLPDGPATKALRDVMGFTVSRVG